MNTNNISAISIQADKTSVPSPFVQKPTDEQVNGLKTANQEINLTKIKSNPNAQPTKPILNNEDLKQITNKLQKIFDAELIFTIDEKSGEHVIKIIDKETKGVIRQIPSEEALQIRESIDKFRKGLLVNLKT